MALQRQIISIPVSGGIDTKTDDRQVQIGKALALENVRLQKTGKLSKRYGLEAQPVGSILPFDGGNGPDIDDTTIKAIVADEDYVAVQTSSGVFNYLGVNDKWIRGTTYTGGAKISVESVMQVNFTQKLQDQDTTDDGAYSVFVSALGGDSVSGVVQPINGYSLSLRDNTTGVESMFYVTDVVAAAGCRVVIVNDSGTYKIHLYRSTNAGDVELTVYSLTWSVLATATVTTWSATAQFDVCKNANKVFIARLSSTSLHLRSYSFAGALVDSSNITVTNALTTDTDGVTSFGNGISVCVDSSNIHISWCAANKVCTIGRTLSFASSVSEFSASTGTDVPRRVANVVTSTGLDIIWYIVSVPNVATRGLVKASYTYTTTYSSGTETKEFRLRFGSKPFIYNGSTYCICLVNETGQIQDKSYFLVDFTRFIMAQIFLVGQSFSALQNEKQLSKVTVVSDKIFTCLKVDSVNSGDQVVFQGKGSVRAGLDFSRTYKDYSRTKVDQRTYLCNGSLLEMDKSFPTENGFMLAPKITATAVNGVANPNVASKTFSYKVIYEHRDSQGNVTRSAPSPAVDITTGASCQSITITVTNPVMSLKHIGNISRNVIAVIYRTEDSGSIYYRTNYILMQANNGDDGGVGDEASDSSISNNEKLYTTGNVLQNDPAPASSYCFSGGGRIFLCGLENRDEIAFSKKQLFGESVQFSDLLRIRASTASSSDKTNITSGAYMDGKIIIFREGTIYFLQGDGPNELGVGSFSDPEIVSSDVGCSEPRSIVMTPFGIMFKSLKGIYLLGRDLQVSYVGAEVEDYNSGNVVSSILSANNNEARFYLNTGTCLVYNYVFSAWSIYTDQTTVDSDQWAGNPVSIIDNKIFKEVEGNFLDNGVAGFYSMKFISPWIKFEQVQGYLRFYQMWLIGNLKSNHTLKCKMYWDYDGTQSEEFELVYDDQDSPQFQFQISLPVQKVESIKFEIWDEDHEALSSGEGYELSNIQLEVGAKAGGYKLASTKSF